MYNIRIKQLPKNGDQRGYSLVDRNDLYIKTNPINQDTNVKNTIGAVPRDEANIEAEGGETVVGDINNDGMIEHSKIVGKRHTEGGVPLNINPGSFIFSDTKKLKIKDPEIQSMFGMAPSKEGYTPAKIAQKYPLNNFMNKLKDDTIDELSKRTAATMLKNNLEKLGQLALVQESMKGFPDGIPAIAQSVMADMQGQQGPAEEQAEGPQGQNPQEEAQEQPQAKYGGLFQTGGQNGEYEFGSNWFTNWLNTPLDEEGRPMTKAESDANMAKQQALWAQQRTENNNSTENNNVQTPETQLGPYQLEDVVVNSKITQHKIPQVGDIYYLNGSPIKISEIETSTAGDWLPNWLNDPSGIYFRTPEGKKAYLTFDEFKKMRDLGKGEHPTALTKNGRTASSWWTADDNRQYNFGTKPSEQPAVQYDEEHSPISVGDVYDSTNGKFQVIDTQYTVPELNPLLNPNPYIGLGFHQQAIKVKNLKTNKIEEKNLSEMMDNIDNGLILPISVKKSNAKGPKNSEKLYDHEQDAKDKEAERQAEASAANGNPFIGGAGNGYNNNPPATTPPPAPKVNTGSQNTPSTPVPVKTTNVKPVVNTKKVAAPASDEPDLFMHMYGGIATPTFMYGGDLPKHQGVDNNSTVTADPNKDIIQKGGKSNQAPDPNQRIKVKDDVVPSGPKKGQHYTLYFEGDKQIIVYDDGTSQTAPRPANNGTDYSQYGNTTVTRIEAEHPTDFIHTNVNFGKFGNQPRLKNSGLYLSSNNQASRNSGDLSPEEWNDFKSRHGNWIEKGYKGGFEQFKKDIVSGKGAIKDAKGNVIGHEPSQWFQDNYNKVFNNRYHADYFAPIGSDKKRNPYQRDSQFGQVTYSAPGIVEPDTPPVPGKLYAYVCKDGAVQKVEYAEGSTAPAGTFASAEEAGKNCGTHPQTVAGKAPMNRKIPWWIQDNVNFAGAMGDTIHKYPSAMTSVDATIPGYVTEDPTRQLAAIEEGRNKFVDTMENSTAGNIAGATAANAFGEPLKQAADVIGQVQNRNVGTVNQSYNTGAQFANQAKLQNANNVRQYMGDTATVNQQYDNAERELKWRQIKAFNNGTTNWMKHKQYEQVLFPQYGVDSNTGDVSFTKGRQAYDENGNPVYDPYINPANPNDVSTGGGYLSGDQYDKMINDYTKNGRMTKEQAHELITKQIIKAEAPGTKAKSKTDITNYDNTPKDLDGKRNGGKIYKFGGKVYYGALQELHF